MCLPIVTCQPYMPVARMEWLEHHQWDDLMAPVAKNLLRRISHVCQHNWKWHLKLVLSCATWKILNHKYPVIALAGPPPLSVLSSVIPLKLHYCDKEKRQTILQKIQPDLPGLTGVFSNPEYSKISSSVRCGTWLARSAQQKEEFKKACNSWQDDKLAMMTKGC